MLVNFIVRTKKFIVLHFIAKKPQSRKKLHLPNRNYTDPEYAQEFHSRLEQMEDLIQDYEKISKIH